MTAPNTCVVLSGRFGRTATTAPPWMYRSHHSIGRAMYYRTFTVAIGLGTLTLSNFNPSIYFGMLTVLAMVAAVLGALLLLPRLIIVLKPLGPEGAQ